LNLFKEFKNSLVEILKRSSLSFIFRIFNLAPNMICGSNANIRLEIDDVEELKKDELFS
jgi:ABC-type lipoprotein export system ATPase subunit